MLFSLKKILLPAIGALALLQCTVARPFPPVVDDGLIEHRETDVNRWLVHASIEDSRLERSWLGRRVWSRKKTRNANAIPETGTGSQIDPPSSKKKVKGNPNAKGRPLKALPNSAKLTLSEDARKELDGMGLHGKARKQSIKWHKKQVKKEMNTNPSMKGKAWTGVIEHVAHKGGSDPKEKNHITASFLTKQRKPIANTYNGGPNHHIYVPSSKGLPQQAKAGSNKNNAEIKGQSKSHQTSVSHTRSRGKSSNKGKGKQNPGRAFSKHDDKGFQQKKHK